MKYLIILAVVAILAIAIGFPLMTSETVTITVTDKERVVDSGDSKYLVFTETEVFENTDCLALGKFNSSDVYGQLEIGETYQVQVYGWRIPFLSMYRNIVKVL
ncbi:MAG: hypothetical protein WC455_10010 [Dehalococcoidia bacterium]